MSVVSRALELLAKSKEICNTDTICALNYLTEGLGLAEKENNLVLQLEFNLDLCYVHRNLSNMEDGFSAGIKAADIAQKLCLFEELFRAYNYMGIFCFYNGLYKRAMHYFRCGLERGSAISSMSLLVSLYTNLGETYVAIDNLDQALDCFEKAIALAETHQVLGYMSPILCNMGSLYLKKNDFTLAEFYFNKAKETIVENTDALPLAELDFQMGMLWLLKGDSSLAYQYFKNSKERYSSLNHRFYLIDVMVKMSDLADLVEMEQRVALLIEAKQLATEIMAQGKLSTIEYRLHEISVLKEDYKSALSHFKAYHEHSSKSDAKKLLAKIEIMSIEQDHSNEFNGEIDLSDFTNMGIFGDSNIELTIESINKDLHYKALTDELTGLANRRKINNMINQIAYSSIKSNYGFLMIDIDHFKWVNDNEGHLYGDQCLIRVANILNEWMSTYKQFVGRYGGEEFLCIVNLVNAFELKLMAETIRTNIESAQIGYRVDSSERTLTVSIGCALWRNEQEDDTYTVLEHADRALYMAKMEGRNRVVIYNN